MDTKVLLWIIGGAFTVIATIAGFSSKAWFTTLISEIRDIKSELKHLNETLIINTQDIKHIKEKQGEHHERLTLVEKRVDKLNDYIYK